MKAVLFDLDGTLLPMNQDEFVNSYFSLLAAKLSQFGYDPKALIQAVWKGTQAMVKNNGKQTNEEVFWNCFANLMGEQARKDIPYFDDFYRHEFDEIQNSCGYNPNSKAVVNAVKQAGLRVILATNPLFPAIATEKRIGWAGLSPDDFEYYTTYENSHYCKPNLDYYREIMNWAQLNPSECIMVGNDVCEDMIARELGMHVFLLTDCLINKDNADISIYPNGNFDALLHYIKKL